MGNPFDKARTDCSEFAWNLLSSLQMLKVSRLELEGVEETTYNMLLEQHCKNLTSEVSH